MTALKEYEKLEATGLWRETLATQRREVLVSFGDTSLMISDSNETALSHWSLPAVQRLNPGETPAIYSPNPDGTETLEIDDKVMIDAIEKVRNAIVRHSPHPGRLRWFILGLFALVIAALAFFWLPGALVRHTISIVPPEKRQQIGLDLLIQITQLTGQRCRTPRGDAALAYLEKRLFPEKSGRILIYPSGVAKSVHLPGTFVLLNKSLVEDVEGPEVAAGYVVLEQARASHQDPLARLLDHAGLLAAFRLLTSGEIKQDILRNYAKFVLVAPIPRPPDAVVLDRFLAAGFPSSPLAYEIDMTGETTLTLIEADPFRNQMYTPLLSDTDWVSLQDICGG